MLESHIVASTAERLREAIVLRHTTAAEVSKWTGISRGSLSQYMSGKFSPKQDRIYILAKYLRVSPAWLMGLDVSMEWSDTIVEEIDNNDTAPEVEKISAKDALANLKQGNYHVFKQVKKLLVTMSEYIPNESETELLCDYRKLSSEQKQTVAALIKTLLQSN